MRIYTAILLLFLVSCQGLVDSDPKEIVNPKFEEFLSELPTIELPYQISCSSWCFGGDERYEGFEEFIPFQANTNCKLQTNSEFDLILYDFSCDYHCPFIYSYDSAGGRIDSLSLNPSYCGEDPFSESWGATKISKDLTFSFADTTKHFFYAPPMRTLDSISVVINEFIMNDQGYFEQTNHQRYLIDLPDSHTKPDIYGY
ncbi:MAG: hypothetical protein ACI857_000345 [Arenicella sp.]|jgi:hypothetical protein